MLSAPLLAGQYEEEVSTTEYLFVKGMIRTVSLTDQSITLQQKKGPVLTISINPETEFEGVRKLEELQIRQVIKLWYRPEHDGNSALKIVKLPDTGC
jgi:hypothetical protein